MISFLVDLLPGLWISLQLTVGALAVGLPLGVLLAVGLLSTRKYLSAPALVVVELGRGFPALVILYLVYFGLPQVGLTLGAFAATVTGLGISFGAYTSEVFRAGLRAVPRGQREAGQALGMPRQAVFFKVLLPQALKIVVPPLLGWAIIYFQATSLAYTLAVPELTSRAYTLATSNFQYLNTLAFAALLYAVIAIPASLYAEYLARRGSRTVATKASKVTLNPTLVK